MFPWVAHRTECDSLLAGGDNSPLPGDKGIALGITWQKAAPAPAGLPGEMLGYGFSPSKHKVPIAAPQDPRVHCTADVVLPCDPQYGWLWWT